MDKRLTREELNGIKFAFENSSDSIGYVAASIIERLIDHAEATFPKEQPTGRDYCVHHGCSNLAMANCSCCLEHAADYCSRFYEDH